MNIQIICNYFGGVLEFVRDVQTEQGTYKKGSGVRVTPSILWLISTGVIDAENDIKMHLRQIHQLEDSEVRELCKLVHPNVQMLEFPKVHRNGIGKDFTIQLEISKGTSFCINGVFDLTVVESMDFGGQPIHTYNSVENQVLAFNWATNKQLDIYNLVPAGKAFGRKNWGKDDYENNPEN